jgi:hypothetical protein
MSQIIDFNSLGNLTPADLAKKGINILSPEGYERRRKLRSKIIVVKDKLLQQQEVALQVPNYVTGRLYHSIQSFTAKQENMWECKKVEIHDLEERRDSKLEQAKRAYEAEVAKIQQQHERSLSKVNAEYSLKAKLYEERIEDAEKRLETTGDSNKQVALLRIQLRNLIGEFNDQFFPEVCDIKMPDCVANQVPIKSPIAPEPVKEQEKDEIWKGMIAVQTTAGVLHYTPEMLAKERELGLMRKLAQDADKKLREQLESNVNDELSPEMLSNFPSMSRKQVADSDSDSDAGLTPVELLKKNIEKDEKKNINQLPPPKIRMKPKQVMKRPSLQSIGPGIVLYSVPEQS